MLESSSVARGASAVTSEKTKKKKKEKKDSAVVTASLFRAISCFLESKGLTKTLAALRSETQLDINDGCGAPALDLVEMVRKSLELRDDSAVEKSEKRDGEFQVNEESVHNPLEKPISKKKKEPKKSAEQTDKDSSKHASESGTDDVMKSNEQKKKKEKKKRSESSGAQALADETMKDAVALPEFNGKSDHHKNDKKKKKKKKKAGELEKGEDERSSPIICEDKSNKKKRKHESSNESEVQNGINSQTQKDDNLQNDWISLTMEAKKHKILPSEESENLASNGSSKSKMSEKKHSTTAANAFQRVKVDAVEFVDERLQDNSYWAKDGAETGYGAKAQEVLGQVRGRDFRHEKTKKKRGSYRGGQIDFQSHSVKFQYSDEDE